MENKKLPFPSMDAYIASFPPDRQKTLVELRTTIQAAAPEAEEKISYDMPTFTFHGRLIYFAAWKKHVAVYGIPASTLDALKDEVSPYKTEKGALLFPFTQPLPLALITQIVQLGVAKNLQTA